MEKVAKLQSRKVAVLEIRAYQLIHYHRLPICALTDTDKQSVIYDDKRARYLRPIPKGQTEWPN